MIVPLPVVPGWTVTLKVPVRSIVWLANSGAQPPPTLAVVKLADTRASLPRLVVIWNGTALARLLLVSSPSTTSLSMSARAAT